jgi:hypothetical protein
LLVGGLYSVLWGKGKEAKIEPCKELTKIDDPEDEKIKQNYVEIEEEEQGQGRGRAMSAPPDEQV